MQRNENEWNDENEWLRQIMKMFALSMTLNMPYVNNHSDVKHFEGKNEEVIEDGNWTGKKIEEK